jgi:hypothetical protein
MKALLFTDVVDSTLWTEQLACRYGAMVLGDWPGGV